MKVFCMLNAWVNYDIVASEIVGIWIKKGLQTNGLYTSDSDIRTFYHNTPYMGYLVSGVLPFSSEYQCYGGRPQYDILPTGVSQQYAVYIWILALTATVLSNIAWADTVIVENNSVVTLPGVSAMVAVAAAMGKPIVYWSDDGRNQWGTTNDPITVGLLSNPYKYLWTAASNQAQNLDQKALDEFRFDAQQQNNNPRGVFAREGQQQKNKCSLVEVTMNKNDVLSGKWRTIDAAIKRAQNNKSDLSSSPNTLPSQRLNALIKVGDAITNYVTVLKAQNPYWKKTYGSGWVPSSDPKVGNNSLWADCQGVILAASGVGPEFSYTGVTKPIEGFPEDEATFLSVNYKLKNKCPKGFKTSDFGDISCPNGFCGCSKVLDKKGLSDMQAGGVGSLPDMNTGLPFGTGTQENPVSMSVPLIAGMVHHVTGNHNAALQAVRSITSAPQGTICPVSWRAATLTFSCCLSKSRSSFLLFVLFSYHNINVYRRS